MGNQQPSNQKNQPLIRSLDKIKLDVACLKVKGYLELNRDRKVNEALNREKVLNACMRSAQRVRVDEYQKLAVLVSDVNYIEACNLVIRCVDIVKDQSFRICGSNGDATKIPDMIPFIETVCFAASHLNLQAVIEFRDMMAVFFGLSSIDPNSLQGVDPELRVLFKSSLPDAMDINAFALRFAEKYGITEQELNVPGHKFSSLCLLPQQGGPSQQGGFSPQQGGQQQPQGGFQQGQGFPQQQGGYQQPNQPYGGMNIQIHLDNPNGGAQYYNATVPQNFGQPQPNLQQPSNNFGQGQQGYGGNPYGANPYGGNGVNPYGGNNQGQQNQNQYQAPHNDHPPSSNQYQQPHNDFAPQNNQYQQPHNDFPPQNNTGNNYGVQAPNSYQPKSMSNQNQQVPNQQSNQPSNYAQTPQQPQQPQYPQTPQPNQGQQPTGQQPHVGNPMGGDDLDDLEARFNRLKNGL